MHIYSDSTKYLRLLTGAIAGVALSACGVQHDPVATLKDPIEGVWLLPRDGNQLQIAPCGTTESEGFCGTFLPADTTAEDLMNSNLLEWGRSLNGVQIVQELMPGENPGEYHGTYYAPDLGDVLLLQIRQDTNDRLSVLIYYGTRTDDVIDMAIGAVIAPVDLADAGWLALKAVIGKEVLGHEHVWTRVEAGWGS